MKLIKNNLPTIFIFILLAISVVIGVEMNVNTKKESDKKIKEIERINDSATRASAIRTQFVVDSMTSVVINLRGDSAKKHDEIKLLYKTINVYINRKNRADTTSVWRIQWLLSEYEKGQLELEGYRKSSGRW